MCPSAMEMDHSPGQSPAPALYMIWRLSDDQFSLPRGDTSASLRGAPPSGLMSQIARWPSRSETNATCWPSGEKLGQALNDAPDVRGRWSEPSWRAVQRCRFPLRDELKTSRSLFRERVGSRSPL